MNPDALTILMLSRQTLPRVNLFYIGSLLTPLFPILVISLLRKAKRPAIVVGSQTLYLPSMYQATQNAKTLQVFFPLYPPPFR